MPFCIYPWNMPEKYVLDGMRGRVFVGAVHGVGHDGKCVSVFVRYLDRFFSVEAWKALVEVEMFFVL